MTDLQKKELWGFGILSFALIFSLIVRALDPQIAGIDYFDQFATSPFPIYLPLLKVLITILCIGAIGVFYFYFFPLFDKEKDHTKLFISVVFFFLSILLLVCLYKYAVHSAQWYHTNYIKSRALSNSMRQSLLITVMIITCLAFYHFVKIKMLDYYKNIDHDNFAKREMFERTLMISLVVLVGSACLLFFKPYMHRVWRYSIWYLVPMYLSLFIIGLYFVYPKFKADSKKFKLFLRILVCTLIVGIPFFTLFIGYANFKNGSNESIFIFFIFLSVPLLWIFTKLFYDDLIKKNVAMGELQLQVDTTTANIDFLRSQINPHFLFNALNTLYGLSLTEQADRTAEGIQKLGEMMRYMLTENQQEQVSIDKEINYISNFIDLQKLRTQASDSIQISFNKYSHDCKHTIAPMLLIPLIENAFKHGISLSNPSWININLSCDETKIYLDVYNSVHPKNENDTEKNSNGIGLANVKQRLKLLYPNKHELQIRNTPNEYIVHLTIESTRGSA